MRRSLPIILLPVLLLTCCASKTAGKAQPKTVRITLYAYPHDWPHDLPLKKLSESTLCDLTRGKKLYCNTLDLSRGIPISSFATERQAYTKISASLRGHSITHVSEDMYLGFLPRPFFNEVGWIDWFLVRRDRNNKIVETIAQKNGGIWGRKKSLVDHVRDGDELIGAWGF